jgi:hypothetical protein
MLRVQRSSCPENAQVAVVKAQKEAQPKALRGVVSPRVPGGRAAQTSLSANEKGRRQILSADWALLCSAVQCSAVQCSAVQCSAVQCSAAYKAGGRSALADAVMQTQSGAESCCCGCCCCRVRCAEKSLARQLRLLRHRSDALNRILSVDAVTRGMAVEGVPSRPADRRRSR